MRKVNYFFVDGPFMRISHPYKQLSIIMFKDYYTDLIVLGVFLLIISKLIKKY